MLLRGVQRRQSCTDLQFAPLTMLLFNGKKRMGMSYNEPLVRDLFLLQSKTLLILL
jgi:hypothetical protein